MDVFDQICLFVFFLLVCQHDNFGTTKYRMMKLGDMCMQSIKILGAFDFRAPTTKSVADLLLCTM